MSAALPTAKPLVTPRACAPPLCAMANKVAPPAGPEIVDGGEDAVAEIGFGHRAKSRDRAARRERRAFALVDMGRMNQAPALVDIGIVEKPLHRPSPAPSDTSVVLADLFGGVDMQRAAFGEADDCRKLIGRHGAERMRRDA